jgi:hypothetical protein
VKATEIRQKRMEVERQIADLLDELEKQTGCTVLAVQVERENVDPYSFELAPLSGVTIRLMA